MVEGILTIPWRDARAVSWWARWCRWHRLTCKTRVLTTDCWDVPVAESAVAPPGPIPNPVVTRGSAGEYCGGDPVGGEAAADAPHLLRLRQADPDAGWSSGSSLGS